MKNKTAKTIAVIGILTFLGLITVTPLTLREGVELAVNHWLTVDGVYATKEVTYIGGESCEIKTDLEKQTPQGIREGAEYCVEKFIQDKQKGYPETMLVKIGRLLKEKGN